MPLSTEFQRGDFSSVAFPAVLWRIFEAHLSGVLEAKKGEVTKKIFFDEGQPVHAESNLLHETLGKYLVAQKSITPEQEQSAVVRALEGQKPFSDALLETGAMAPAQLYESLRKNFALKILDCFAWDQGTYAFTEDPGAAEKVMALRMNSSRLVLQGVRNFFPAERILTSGLVKTDGAYRVVHEAPADQDVLKLTAEEIGFLNRMKSPKSPDAVAKESGLPEEDTLRWVYAFRILGLLEPAEPKAELSLDELVGATLLQTLKPQEPTPSVEKADAETRKLADTIASDHMHLMGMNYFQLFGLEESATAVQIRDKFVDFAAKYNPGLFLKPGLGDFRRQGEELFLRGVKAFATLSDFDSKTKYTDKLKAERAKAGESGKKKAGEAFKIQTTLLDADMQFRKGLKHLKDRKFDLAIEFFQYAKDIDSRNPDYWAHLGWATFQKSPERNAREALELLTKARGLGASANAAFFLGKFLVMTGKPEEALEHLKTAVELEPKNIDMVRELRNAERPKK